MSFEVPQIYSECGHREQTGLAFAWQWSPFTPYWRQCVGTSAEINYFSKVSRDETVNMKDGRRETKFHPVKGQRGGGIGPSLSLCGGTRGLFLVST